MTTKNTADKRLTKAETVALWHAVSNMDIMVRQMPSIEGITPEQVEVEKARVGVAKQALKKVNKLRERGL